MLFATAAIIKPMPMKAKATNVKAKISVKVCFGMGKEYTHIANAICTTAELATSTKRDAIVLLTNTPLPNGVKR